MFATNLYYLTQHTRHWRHAALVIHEKTAAGKEDGIASGSEGRSDLGQAWQAG